MIEKVVLDYLTAELNVPVMMEVPEVPSGDFPDVPARFVVIEKVGASKENHGTTASLAFQSYAESMYEAAALDEVVREAVENIIVLNAVAGVRLTSNYNHTDPRTKQYRYQCVYDIYYV